MAYRYINPGYGGLFEVLPINGYTQTTNAAYTKTGVGFSCGDLVRNSVPANTKEIWFKFDYEMARNQYYTTLLSIASNSKSIVISKGNSNQVYDIYINGSRVSSITATSGIITGWYIHVKSSKTSGVFEVYWGDSLEYEFNGNVLDDEDVLTYDFASGGGDSYLSNIIVSDVMIGKTENVIILPIASTTGTMTDNGDGTYTADAVDEYISQTVNVSALALPSDTVITGIAIAGNTAYRDGEGISYMTAIQDSVPIGDAELLTNSQAGILIAKTVNQTIAQLAASTYGWKAKA